MKGKPKKPKKAPEHQESEAERRLYAAFHEALDLLATIGGNCPDDCDAGCDDCSSPDADCVLCAGLAKIKMMMTVAPGRTTHHPP